MLPPHKTLQHHSEPAAPSRLFYASISASENVQVRDYLFGQSDLNLTRSDSATVASNILYMMELLPPPKAFAVAYLDSGGAAPLPPRQASPTSDVASS